MLTLRTKLSVVFLALLLTSGLGIGLAAPASATHTGQTVYVRSCMYYSNGAAYAYKPVYLTMRTAAWWDEWVVYGSKYTDGSGCAQFRVDADHTYRFVAYSKFSGGYFYGRSESQYVRARWYTIEFYRFTVYKYYN